MSLDIEYLFWGAASNLLYQWYLAGICDFGVLMSGGELRVLPGGLLVHIGNLLDL